VQNHGFEQEIISHVPTVFLITQILNIMVRSQVHTIGHSQDMAQRIQSVNDNFPFVISQHPWNIPDRQRYSKMARTINLGFA